MKFQELLDHVVPPPKQFHGTLLSLDPGETTGFSVWICSADRVPQLKEYGELPCEPIDKGIDALTLLIERINPDFMVFEDYKVYAWKSASHSWGALHTPQLLGTIKTLARQKNLKWVTQMAQQPKQFCDDTKLRAWGYYAKGKKHARDSIRHALFFLLFGHIKVVGDQKITIERS